MPVAARGRDLGRKLIASLLLPPTCQGKRPIIPKTLAQIYTYRFINVNCVTWSTRIRVTKHAFFNGSQADQIDFNLGEAMLASP